MRKVLFILGQLTDSDVEWMSTHGTHIKVAKGTELIKFGTQIETVYLVLDGSMGVFTARGVRIGEVASGDILGEMSLVDSGLTSASILVEQDGSVLAIAKQVLIGKLKQDIGFAARFYRALSLFLADRMRNSMLQMGYDKDQPKTGDAEADSLDVDVLDNLHLAGARFERLLKKLAA
jgi:CRP/FNR family cyclic AMP-dependent transcriptional regulator